MYLLHSGTHQNLGHTVSSQITTDSIVVLYILQMKPNHLGFLINSVVDGILLVQCECSMGITFQIGVGENGDTIDNAFSLLTVKLMVLRLSRLSVPKLVKMMMWLVLA
jgi:hypothetical protein